MVRFETNGCSKGETLVTFWFGIDCGCRIKFRFGTCLDAKLLRTMIAITSLTSGILATTYFAVGGGEKRSNNPSLIGAVGLLTQLVSCK